jgi:hypothetical protein
MKMAEKVLTRKVTLTGLADIMFDRYPGDNKTQLTPEKKFYFMPDGETLMFPSMNLISFLSAQNTDSAPKRLIDKRKYKEVASAILSFTAITPFEIPFTSNGEPVKFSEFDAKKFYVHNSVARLAKGVPNPKARPVLRTPWELGFEISIFPNKEFTEDMLHDLFVRGGLAIGLGTFRGVFGKFKVSEWK